MFRNLFDGPHLLIVLLVILVLFGGKKLPDAARGLGRSLRIFKSEVKQLRDDDDDEPARTPPLEGRVMDDEKRARETEHLREAERAREADQKRSA
jgi:sec-independent protein translocase protein TatA